MRFFGVLSVALSVAVAQEIGVSGDHKVVSGVNAIDNPNVNNGVQVDSSLVAGDNGASEGNLFNNVVNGHFSNVNSNAAVQDNLINNAGITKVSGNSGWTANGDNNALGAVQNDFGVFTPFFKRENEADHPNNHYHAAAPVYNAPAHKGPAVYHHPVVPYFAVPVVIPAPVHYYAPIFHHKPAHVPHKAPAAEKPVYHSAAYHAPPSAHIEEKNEEQKATIIQNQV
ncbi:hypothetical protein COEREDRAFT_7516 [Coemansia reversa NRRL 1564]|uniref:Uncharacterized protein n=1 Tax=Coemansia reversa (strain ATCC 12441 / NRRL 1564) TaxID=763665 RepID=A0A2G5BEV3_COERN|nr:hypothetical protein COEREDRAFT_7516 [Coemansia reversa NRRL 1564]|eukprot:PIA17556.1 hypothetical protein COEREDRAFT_7516 [Coemansia reversa NRRL 1564]